MKEKIFELLKNNLKNPKLYVGAFIFLIVVVLLFPYIDANYFYYGRVEKRIGILDQISKLDKREIENNPVLLDEYNSILNEISKQKDGSLGSVFITDNSKIVRRNKFLAGGILSWLIGLICLFVKIQKKWYKLFGLVIFALFGAGLGYISMILPTVISPICNYVFMPLMQCVVLGMLVTSNNKGKN